MIRDEMPRPVRAGKPCEVRDIPTELLYVGQFRTRSDANLRRDVDELTGSIASLGIIEPIVVRSRDGGAFDVIAGERRLAAAKQVGLERVPCVVLQCSDSEAMSMALVENLQRCDLDPIERALCIRRLIEEFDIRQSDLGMKLGISQSSVAHYLKLLSLPGEIRKLIETGDLTMGHGKALNRVSNTDKAVALAHWCVQTKKSVRQLEAEIKRMQHTQSGAGGNGRQKQLREHRELPNGVYLVLKENVDGSGTLEIPYYSARERDWAINILARGTCTASDSSGNPDADAA